MESKSLASSLAHVQSQLDILKKHVAASWAAEVGSNIANRRAAKSGPVVRAGEAS